MNFFVIVKIDNITQFFANSTNYICFVEYASSTRYTSYINTYAKVEIHPGFTIIATNKDKAEIFSSLLLLLVKILLNFFSKSGCYRLSNY